MPKAKAKNLPSKLKNHTSFLISDVARLQRTIMDRRADNHDLTRSQWWLLSFLIYFDGATQQELADAMDISKGGLTKLLERLEKKNMILRVANEQDQRSKRIYLSEAARSLTSKLEKELTAAGNESFAVLDAVEIKQLNSLLSKVRAHILNIKD